MDVNKPLADIPISTTRYRTDRRSVKFVENPANAKEPGKTYTYLAINLNALAQKKLAEVNKLVGIVHTKQGTAEARLMVVYENLTPAAEDKLRKLSRKDKEIGPLTFDQNH